MHNIYIDIYPRVPVCIYTYTSPNHKCNLRLNKTYTYIQDSNVVNIVNFGYLEDMTIAEIVNVNCVLLIKIMYYYLINYLYYNIKLLKFVYYLPVSFL